MKKRRTELLFLKEKNNRSVLEMKSVLCLSFVGMCLWAMLIRKIQGYPYRQPFWNSYNSQVKSLKPASNAMQFPWYYSRLRYPHQFLDVPINKQPYASDPRLQKGKRPTDNGRWLIPGNGFAGPINFPSMPMFPTMPRQTTIQRERGTSPRNEKVAPIEKSEESSTDRDVSSTSEYPDFQETTRTQQRKENQREEPPTNKTIDLDRESVSPTCQGNCEDYISILIEEALRNGELLRSDEWIRWQNATKYGSYKDKWREEKEMRKKPSESVELDPGPMSSCRGNCTDSSGSDKSKIDETLDESSRHGEWLEKQNATEGYEKEARKPSERDDVQESKDPAPVCGNSTFCMHPTNYPEELVNRAIRQNDSLRLFQSVDPVSEVGDRLEFDELNDSPFCGSYVRLIYPRSAETMDRRWLYIVNQDNLRQGVRIEVCVNHGSVCGDLDDYLPGGYRAFCKQKYIYRELVAVDSGIVKKDTFRFPSSCCCYREFMVD